MSDYLEITFKGNFEEVRKFFDDKNWDHEAKRISENKALFKINPDCVDEINFFLGIDLNDGKLVLEKIEKSTVDAYENAEEFEEEEKDARFKEGNEDDEKEPGFFFGGEEDELLKSDRNTPAEGAPKVENPFNVNDLSASCPVKAVLKDGDPMAYLTSPSFLGKFFIASSLILFVMNILG